MARKLRVEYPGAIDHVMNRGDRREPIFRDEADQTRFVETLGEVCGRSGWLVHAYCLMPNHFHLVVETPQPTLVAGMKWFLGTYTGRFNRRHKVFGHLFSGRYKALIVDGSGSGYLRRVCDYAHLNPARAQLIKPQQRLREYRWSSWPEYLKSPAKRPVWLRVDRVMGEAGIPKDSAAGRRELERRMESRRAVEKPEDYRPIRRGWFFGWANGWGLNITGMSAVELGKGNDEKVKIAVRLRRETLMTVAWIAKRLRMGSVANVNTLLFHRRRGKQK